MSSANTDVFNRETALASSPSRAAAHDDRRAAPRRGRSVVPACPGCRESHNIEPLLRQDAVWHVRCLRCGYGFTFVQESWPASEERRRRPDRRQVPRAGRRSTDLPGPIACDRCAHPDVQGWLRTGDTLWARCGACGCVQRVPPA